MSDHPHLGPTPNDWATHYDLIRHDRDAAMEKAKLRELAVLAYVNGFTLWNYKAPSRKLAEIEGPGFFAEACDMLVGGDHMHVSAADGGGLYRVGDRGKIERMEASALAGVKRRWKAWVNFRAELAHAPAYFASEEAALSAAAMGGFRRVAVPCWLIECEEGE